MNKEKNKKKNKEKNKKKRGGVISTFNF